jgi:hypothetical protein
VTNISIYLDESGDLGFDESKQGASEYFVVTLLVCENMQTTRTIKNAILRTIKNKLNAKKSKKRIVQEIKGSSTTLQIKNYFFKQCPAIGWEVFSLILNKKRVYKNFYGKIGKQKLYNYIAKTLIEKVKFPKTTKPVHLVLDKCKNSTEIKDFNCYLKNQIQSFLPNIEVRLDISHKASHETPELQAVDLFCWGIARKISQNNTEWYDVYKEKIKFEDVYLK